MGIAQQMNDAILRFKQNHYYGGYLKNPHDPILKMRARDLTKIENEAMLRVRTNADVVGLIDSYHGTVSFVENHVIVGAEEDAYNMELALHLALLGLSRMARLVEREQYGHTAFEVPEREEIESWFERLDAIYQRMQEQNLRRAMQDD